MLDEKLTTCLDRDSGVLVQIPANASEVELETLRRRSYRGMKRLMCALCWEGIDAAAGTEAPLLLREPAGRRPHFAHPAGRAPHTGQHSAEMMRQLSIRADLQRWALQQPTVCSVRAALAPQEPGCGQHVVVEFSGGQVVVLRVQAEPLTQQQWLAQRARYADARIVDEWLWAPDVEGGWLGHSAARWEINSEGQTGLLAAISGAGGGVRRYPVSLSELTLTVEGLQGPQLVLREEADAALAAQPLMRPHAAVEPSGAAEGGLRCDSGIAAGVEYRGMPVVDLDAVLGQDAAEEIAGSAGMQTGRAIQLVYKTLGLYEECAVAPLSAEFGDRCPQALGVLARYGYLELLERGGIAKARRTALGRRCGRVMTEPRMRCQRGGCGRIVSGVRSGCRCCE